MSATAEKRLQAEQLNDEAVNLIAGGESAAAAAAFRQALALDPDLLDALHGLIRALQDAGEHREALLAAQELIARDPEDPLAHTSLSILYQRQGRIAEAEGAALQAKLLGWKRELRENAPSHE